MRDMGHGLRKAASLALAASMVLAVGACSGGVSDSTVSGSAAATGAYKAATGGELHVYTWAGYMPKSVIKAYEKDTGTKLTVDTFDSNEALEAKMKSTGGTGYDVLMPSDYMVKQMISEGLLLKFDTSSLPNAKNIKSEFTSPYYDKKLQYSAPYLAGYTGIVYDSSSISAADAPTSWKKFFSMASSAGKAQVLDDQIEITNAALRATGSEQCSTNPEDYQKASTLLTAFKNKVGVLSSEGVADRLASGEEKYGMAWSYDAYQAIVSKPSLKFVYPTDGTSKYVDNMAISVGAKNVAQAKTFINWMLNPKNQLPVNVSGGAGSVLKGGDDLLPASMKKSNTIVPSSAELKTLRMEQSCSNKINDYYTQLFEDFRR
ncbi:spermidine/putrescine ABC transporter substrate-binding protein [uncultured Bifidobacterium sp.]|uniref:ABC transporter substrate-binding protein n=1 Tax=uncultured Bifidobacterium sp. TaxID=165187 RepID=UPI0028DC5A4E|nr:spermidine/putrescine ABC transporter substrate-binding protein [uncultured Bifidobacterium sp.]